MKKNIQTKKKGGRPVIVLDPQRLYDLASVGCTKDEIATMMGCCVHTLNRKHGDLLHKAAEESKMSLRRKMHQVAMAGNVSMLVWLSKQRLGMRDRQPDEAPQTVINVVCNEVP